MLQEAFDRPTTQILSLFALSKHLALKPELSVGPLICAHGHARRLRALKKGQQPHYHVVFENQWSTLVFVPYCRLILAYYLWLLEQW